ncbi:chemotaxis protein CheW [Shewanella schlegeliana]|uniref:Chemotaxis protein CheW n=1 Tax=Shewanella schlegeliana TaxID=190308 RepID=A0ABS1SSU0_9GAMM|nr:chemotaxis protein CheW [Shewanella schlegeliana]MBL4911607.1 chemotaxis protein CheW [Shewanella schlegeliana]MCL1111709.1 chemotaxis protein CheW [Shewanella schlegeliana]GIU36233.1 chemotaxis protein CheW [Shewanella schlegeliana]
MSKSVDDAVCDYFSLLLSEPKAELAKAEVVKANRPEKESVDERLSRQALELLFAKAKTEASSENIKPQASTQVSCDANLVPALSEAVTVSKSQVGITESEEKSSTALLQLVIEPVTNDSAEEVKESLSATPDVINPPKTAALTATQISSTQTLLDKLDEEFQVLFFNVAGLTLAVPLVSLGGIVNLEKVTSLIGRPDWYLGVQQYRDAQLNVVDTCAWVMPEKYDAALAQKVSYQYVVVLEDSHWGLGCESLINTINIKKSEVNWRSQAGKRPWLAGVVKEQMCGILNVEALVQMLGAGMGCQDVIQS